MSLPVTRRIARAALLVAAGAAPVVAAAGSASAAQLPVKAPGQGGLVAPLDSQHTSKTVNRGAHDGVDLVSTTGNAAARELPPATVRTVGPAVKKAVPISRGVVGKVQDVARPLAKNGLATNGLPALAQGLLGQQLAPQPAAQPRKRLIKAPKQHVSGAVLRQHVKGAMQHVPHMSGAPAITPATPALMLGGIPLGG
ncbi:ATP-binding protein [Streptomyces sp. NPDC048506]|uniref:ATP-binding protein n=1 Tax=Streptomyces sp. NPDC048506 TaxID=3155028 RepID=UPI003447547A